MNAKKSTYFLFVLIGLVFSSISARASNACEIENAIVKKLEILSNCTVEISTEKMALVSFSENDYTSMSPKIMKSDMEVVVKTKICGNSDRYYFWVRDVENKYEVISYASFSQPE